jgi:hypothetical protein
MAVREPRFESDLAVVVAGRDANGNRFKQTARVKNISRRGGLLSGIRCVKTPGDALELEYRGRKAAFRIVWIDLPSGTVGICAIDQKCIWAKELPAAGTAGLGVPWHGSDEEDLQSRYSEGSQAGVPAYGERLYDRPQDLSSTKTSRISERQQRRFPRFRCMGGVAATANNQPNRLWGRLTVISLGGCYIETTSPFRPNTSLELLIGAHGVELRVHGEVRYARAGQGMGVMFTGMSQQSNQELERLVASASGRR